MFIRRKRKTRWQAVRDAVWPSMGFYRLIRYYKYRMGRLQGTPYAIAAGFASGVAVSFTPFMGLHVLLGILMSWALRGSIMAMVFGTVFAGNFWTFPLIWVATLNTGEKIMGREPRADAVPLQFSFGDLFSKPLEFLVPMSIGSIPFFFASWILSFYVMRHLIRGYQASRRNRIARNSRAGG